MSGPPDSGRGDDLAAADPGGTTVAAPSRGAQFGRNLQCGLRLALLRHVARDRLAASPGPFADLVLANLALTFLLAVAGFGLDGQFNLFELPRALFGVTLLLALGLLVSQADREPDALLVLPVALISAGTVVTLVGGLLVLPVQHQVVPTRYWPYISYGTFAWWCAAIAVAAARYAPADLRSRMRNVAAALVLLAVPAWFLPQGSLWIPRMRQDADPLRKYGVIADEAAFYGQQEALERALNDLQPGRPGVTDLYLVAAGLYAPEDVFMKEVRMIETLFRQRFDAGGRTIALINNTRTVREYPLASLTSLSAALNRVGEIMDRDEDVLVLYLSSHGSESHRLSVEFWPLRLDAIDPGGLKRVLDESGIKWRVLVVSACYSGGFVDPLRDENTLIITASSASRPSFGCGTASNATYLAQALFDEALRRTHSFESAFTRARATIEDRERREKFDPSEPQIYVGAAIRRKLEQLARRLDAESR